MSKSIRVGDDTHAALAALRGDEEFLSPLLRERWETIESAAGLWADTDAADGARKTRRQMKEDISAQ